MSAFEQLTMGSAALPPSGSTTYGVSNQNNANMILPNSVANFNNLLPLTGDFCWEMWCSIDGLGGQMFSFGNLPGYQFGVSFYQPGDGTAALSFLVGGGQGPDTYYYAPASNYAGAGWMHLAFARSGTTVSTWVNGVLSARLSNFTGTIDSSVSTTIWIFGGPVGDRDETYGYSTTGSWRNLRYVLGDSVYGTSNSFIPPPVSENIPVITGTQYIWWLNPTSDIPERGVFNYDPRTPDYTADAAWLWNTGTGASNGTLPVKMPFVFPGGDPAYPLTNYSTGFSRGSFTNMGTAPNQPIITSAGPAVPGFWANTVGDFTATGTNVRIYNSGAQTLSPGDQSCIYILYFYVPGNITNECKNLLVTEAANGFVLNIGRTGYGLDWVSIETYEGTELAYGAHVWARNAWNYLVIQRLCSPYLSAYNFAVWGGWAGASTVPKIPMYNAGFTTYAFAGSNQPFSIGCKAGSSVSCQMYLGEIWTWIGNYASEFYDFNSPFISQQTVTPFVNYGDAALAMIFDGANGSTTFNQLL